MAKPFASKAQIEHFKKGVANGTITQSVFDEMMALTKDHENLPDRLHPKKDARPDAEKPEPPRAA